MTAVIITIGSIAESDSGYAFGWCCVLPLGLSTLSFHLTVRVQEKSTDELVEYMKRKRWAYWVIPPDEDAAFVAAMEQVLEVYQRPEDARFPVVAMDERPVQLLDDLRPPIAPKPGRIARIDYEYKRIGSVSAFLFTNPLQGWRRVSVRELP